MWPKKSRQGFFTAKNRKHLLKLKYPEQVAEPESPITVRIFLFDAVSFKKRYLPTAPFLLTGNRLGLIQKRILYILISEKNEMR